MLWVDETILAKGSLETLFIIYPSLPVNSPCQRIKHDYSPYLQLNNV